MIANLKISSWSKDLLDPSLNVLQALHDFASFRKGFFIRIKPWNNSLEYSTTSVLVRKQKLSKLSHT